MGGGDPRSKQAGWGGEAHVKLNSEEKQLVQTSVLKARTPFAAYFSQMSISMPLFLYAVEEKYHLDLEVTFSTGISDSILLLILTL